MENRESFFARLNPFTAPADLRDVKIAYMMAKHGHRAQVRKELDEHGQPVRYFEHLRRVAIILLDELDIRNPEMICAALLHDSLEDTQDITEDIIEHIFGKYTVTIVKLLSKVPKEGYYDRLMKFADRNVWIIKSCDRLDNLRSLSACNIEFQKRQVAETRKVIYDMLDSLAASSHTTEELRVSNYLRDEIRKLTESFQF